jgi:hypothetical protein
MNVHSKIPRTDFLVQTFSCPSTQHEGTTAKERFAAPLSGKRGMANKACSTFILSKTGTVDFLNSELTLDWPFQPLTHSINTDKTTP